MMTTGDLKNNLRKLVSELKQIQYPQSQLDIKGVAQGIPKAFLPIVHFVFLDYSISLAQYFASKEYELYGKTDLRFMEAVYKVLRDEFGYKPQLTREQFLTIGFAERKIITLYTILKLLREKHEELNPKAGKTEKKKVKQSLPSSHYTNGTTVKENLDKVIKTSSDHFPGPLPVDTDMKSFRSNEQAMKSGLGLKEPLVTRMFNDGDLGLSTGGHQNSGPSGKTASFVKDSVPSNLIVKPTGDHRVVGVKFQVSQNSETRSNLFRPANAKSVTWEDEVKESQNRQSEKSDSLLNGTMVPNSVPARVHSISHSGSSPAYYPTQSSTEVIPNAIPSPVSMTTAPMPSPDLMLTPLTKNSHQAIPLSSSRNGNDFQAAPFSDDNLPRTRVVRHSNLTEVSNSCVAKTNSSSEAEVFVLKQQIQELQEKFDSMVLLNNEMSARVVLLESKVKLLEEGSGNKSCCNCRSPLPTIGKENALNPDKIVVSGFNVQGDKKSLERSPVNTSASVSHKHNGDIGNYNMAHKPILRNNSSSRKLFTDASTSDSDHVVKEPTDQVLTPHLEKSDDDDNDSDDTSVVISPFPSVSKLSHVFTNSSTKNTVVNVQKRLQETRELLARTNRDFAAKFNQYQVE